MSIRLHYGSTGYAGSRTVHLTARSLTPASGLCGARLGQVWDVQDDPGVICDGCKRVALYGMGIDLR